MPRLSLLGLAALAALASCRSDSDSAAEPAQPAPVIADTLLHNQLADAPSDFLRAHAGSAIRWQHWDPAVLGHADQARRLVLALVGSARYPGCAETLEAIEADATLVRRLNEEFVPVLADLDLCRETSMMTTALSAQRQLGVGFPFLILLDPDGAPVTWEPLAYYDDRSVRDFLNNAVEVIGKLWSESPDYVREDSQRKLAERRKLLPEPEAELDDEDLRLEIYRAAIRRLTSYYDADLSSFAHSGGLFPAGLLETLADASRHPALPERLRQRSREAIDAFLASLLRSSSIDPLDGGIYPASRAGRPSFQRDSLSQARAIRALARVAKLTDNPLALDTAVAAARFSERHFATPDGLFSLTGGAIKAPTDEWLWTEEQLAATLDEGEFAVWKRRAGTRSIGNLDPSHQALRFNVLSAAHPVTDIAAGLELDEAQVRERLESGRRKLLAAREARFPAPGGSEIPSAAASLRMVSAYAALFAADGQDEWLRRARELGEACRHAFAAESLLSLQAGQAAAGIRDARAFDYALAVQAGLDLGAVTLDDSWNQWAAALLAVLGEHFVADDGILLEVRPESAVFGINHEERLMVFDETSLGMVRLALARAEAIGLDLPANLRPLALPEGLARNPIVHTDNLTALGQRFRERHIAFGPDTPAPLREAIARLPLQIDPRRGDAELGTKVRLTSAEGDITLVEDPEELRREPLARP